MNETGRASSVSMGDLWGGLAAMIVALPSSVAFGVAVFAVLGPESTPQGALYGILGAVALGLIAPFAGGTARLITAPCAPAAAVLAVFAAELSNIQTASGKPLDPTTLILFLTYATFLAGALQCLAGILKVGRFIKFIPYPVVAGYLTGVGILIILKQIPILFGLPRGTSIGSGLLQPGGWNFMAISIGAATLAFGAFSSRFSKRLPPTFVGLIAGICVYGLCAIIHPELRSLDGNQLVIGRVASFDSLVADLSARGGMISISMDLWRILWPGLMLAILLSIDTLKTCVILDISTSSRHEPNRELMGQGCGNMIAAIVGGMPGAGTSGPTFINVLSGARTRWSGFFAGILMLIVLLALRPFIAWLPLPALAGILFLVGARMVDRTSLRLLRNRSTYLDFAVIAAVVLVAVFGDLISASALGLGLTILLFLREQVRSTVVRRKIYGDAFFSRRRRITEDLAVLTERGRETVIYELQGSLFFGTTDRLLSELEDDMKTCRNLILDFRRVQSVDYSAVHVIARIENQLESRGVELILTDVPRLLPTGRDLTQYLEAHGISARDSTIRIFPNLDAALEWVEDRILSSDDDQTGRPARPPLELDEIELFRELPRQIIEELRLIIEERNVGEGERIVSVGDEGDELFLIRKGTVRIILPIAGGKYRHLATIGRRNYFGEMAFLDKEPRSADALTASPTFLYVLSRARFDTLAAKHPELAGLIYFRLSRDLALRLRQADVTIRENEEM